MGSVQNLRLTDALAGVAIFALVLSLLLPVLAFARQDSQDARCRSQLSQIAMAGRMYANDREGALFSHLWWNSTDHERDPGIREYLGLDDEQRAEQTLLTCPRAAERKPPRGTFRRTYAMNEILRANPNNKPKLQEISSPQQMAFFFDSGVVQQHEDGNYNHRHTVHPVTDVLQDRFTFYPHVQNDEPVAHVSFLDGHADQVTQAALQEEHTPGHANTLFWRGESDDR